MSSVIEVVVHGELPDAAAMRAAIKVADAAVPLQGLVAHSRPVFVRHDTAVVDGEVRAVLVYVVKTWSRNDTSDERGTYLRLKP